MAVGWSVGEANGYLDTIDGDWVQLHVGDPGAAGTANPAAETTRQQLNNGAAAAGSVQNNAALTWTLITGSETATHFSRWTLATGGVFKGSGTLSGPAYTAGETVNIAVGALTHTAQNVAA